MSQSDLIKEAGLTDGEAKVYLAMLKIGESTVGPILEESKVANSIVYRLLESLMEKGLASFITKDKTKYFKAAEPKKILEYIEQKKEHLEESKKAIQSILPSLMSMGLGKSKTSFQVYEGFKGIQTAFEHYYDKLKKGDATYCWGIYATQHEKYHAYWHKDHLRRARAGIKAYLLFNQGTDLETLKNRNSYTLCDARYMPTPMKTPAWFLVYKDTTLIVLHLTEQIALEIVNQEVADTFKAYFDDFWSKSKPFKN
jgi:HTH-type transcriptional regulator, sugar sensing transcriptional regulator